MDIPLGKGYNNSGTSETLINRKTNITLNPHALKNIIHTDPKINLIVQIIILLKKCGLR